MSYARGKQQDPEFNSWNPMADDFEDTKFNRYNQGVGRDLMASDGDSRGVQLFVANVPVALGQDGFFNLFAEHGNVLESKLIPSNGSSQETYGFITMKTAVDADVVISKLNNVKFGRNPLKVSPAITKEEKLRRKKLRQAEEQFASGIGDNRWEENSAPLLPLKTPHDDSLLNQKGQRNEKPLLILDKYGFWLRRNPMWNHPRFAMGRGQLSPFGRPGLLPPEPPSWGHPGMGRGYHYGQRQNLMGGRQTADRSSGYFKEVISAPPNMEMKAMKMCVRCSQRGSTFRCGICKMYYCSPKCQKDDWPNHKPVCLVIKEHFEGEGSASETKDLGYSSDIEKAKSQGTRGNVDGKKKPNSNSSTQKENKCSSASKGSENNIVKDENARNSAHAGLNSKKENEKKDGKKGSKQPDPKKKSTQTEDNKSVKGNNSYDAELKNKVNDRTVDVINEEQPPAQKDGENFGILPEFTMPVGAAGECLLTYYEDPGKFWISLTDTAQDFGELCYHMDTTLAEPFSGPAMNPKAGDLVAAQFEEQWCRARVVTVSHDSITVFFVDFGNEDTVQLQDLRPLTSNMLCLPAQTFCCCLSQLKPLASSKWSQAAVSTLKDWFGEPLTKILSFKLVAKRGASYAMEIVNNSEESAIDVLLKKRLAQHVKDQPGLPSFETIRNSGDAQQLSSRKMANTVKHVRSELSVGQEFSLTLVEVKSPEKFTGQQISETCIECLTQLESLLPQECEKDNKAYTPVKGELVAAKFTEDECWYRAEVVNIEGNNISLFFIDFGNSETQSTKNIRELKNSQLQQCPALALKCALHGVKIPSDVDPGIILQEFQNLLTKFQDGINLLAVVKQKTEELLLIDFVSTTVEGPLSVLLNKKLATLSPIALTPRVLSTKTAMLKQSLSKSFQKAKPPPPKIKELDIETLPVSSQECTECTVTFVKSCAEFYVRRNNREEEFSSLLKEMNNNVQSLSALAKPSVGCMAAVQFKLDRIWYRARLEEICNNICQVFFVDYGNREMVETTHLRVLKDNLYLLPAQAIKCQLKGSPEALPEEVHEQFREYLENQSVNVRVVAHNGGICVLQMFAPDGTDINAILEAQEEVNEHNTKTDICSSQSRRQVSNMCLEKEMVMQVDCVNMISPMEFYVQITALSANLVEMTLSLKSRLDSNPQPAGSVVVGDFVASRFSQDEEIIWYRVRVDAVVGSKCSIFFIDFGNAEDTDVSHLLKLPEEDLDLPACAVKCRLARCLQTSEELNKQFANIGQNQINSIEVVDQDEDTYIVEVLDCQGGSITDKFIADSTTSQLKMGQRTAQSSTPVKSQVSVTSPSKTVSNVDKVKSPSNSGTSPVLDKTSPSSRPALSPTVGKTSSPSKQALSPSSPASLISAPSLDTEALSLSGQPVSVLVTFVKSCSLLYVTLNEEHLQLQLLEVMTKLNSSASTAPSLSRPSVGALCAAQFSQDGSWYRARVEQIGKSGTCTVQFVDFGNSEETSLSELKQLDVSLTSLPAQAIACCLRGHESDTVRLQTDSHSENAQKLVEKLKEEILERVVTICYLDRKAGTYIVAVNNERGESIDEMFLPVESLTPKLHDLTFQTPSVKESEAVLVHMDTLEEFYCYTEGINEVLLLSQKIKEDVKVLGDSICQPVLDGVYTCDFEGVWYRCVVQQIEGSQVLIKYIDFGNAEKRDVKDLKPISPERLSLPVCVMRCKLHGVQPQDGQSWDSEELIRYKDLVQMGQQHIAVVKEEQGIFWVNLSILNEDIKVDVAEDLVQSGLAKRISQHLADNISSTSPHTPHNLEIAKSNEEALECTESEDYEDEAIRMKIQELERQLAASRMRKGAKKL